VKLEISEKCSAVVGFVIVSIVMVTSKEWNWRRQRRVISNVVIAVAYVKSLNEH
jgi:hypothetical protein